MQAIARSASRTARGSGESDDLFEASDLPGKPWHLFELANRVEPSPIFAISHDFEAMPFQLTDSVDLGGRSGIDIAHVHPQRRAMPAAQDRRQTARSIKTGPACAKFVGQQNSRLQQPFRSKQG
jgi:hypothetical protein